MEIAESIEIENHHPSLVLDADLCRSVLMGVIRGEDALLENVTLILSDHAAIHELNRTYLGHDYETDVLAFVYGEGPAIDGEIYVDLDTAAERHAEFGASFEQEALRYAVHGLLHLIGYSDKDEEGKRRMHTLEDRYLANFEGRMTDL
ncbi:MAG: rRNA maturation RNase YbeY [Rhodothermales bacterium]